MNLSKIYHYHGGKVHAERLKLGSCRCASSDVGKVFNLKAYITDGLVHDPRQPKKLLTTPQIKEYETDLSPPGSGYGKTFIYAVDKHHDIHVATDSERKLPDAVKHETLFHNEPVLAAGEIWFQEGVIHGINDLSGSYNTKGQLESFSGFAISLLVAIERNKLRIDSALREKLNNLANHDD